ncbi:MAG: glycosyltransferase family 4 protein, partial [Prevotella sp.]|nr:glycosyltransferase family 4 protein [Prevotella sp.]
GRIPPANILPHEGNVALIDRVPKVFAISRAVHDELKAKYGVESTVVNNGIITGNFKRRDNDLPGERFRIVQVSRLEHDKKGQDLLIRAVADLHDEGISVDFIGEGKSLNYLQSLAKELNISGQVCFLGKRTQEYISAHLCDYDLFVQASRYEGFALTVAEAMAANVPVLVSAGQGPAEVCCEDTYGCVFANGDYNDLVAKIRWIRSQYPDALRKATKAREHVCAAYDVSVTARRYIEEYQKTGAINKETDG